MHYVDVPYTKNERLHPENGRKFPVTFQIEKIIEEVKTFDNPGEYFLSDQSGNFITTNNLSKRITQICKNAGFNITNNHAFRKTLNTNVLISSGITATERAQMLGHSVDTNPKYYSYSRDEDLKTIRNKLNECVPINIHSSNIVPFKAKRKATSL